MIHLISLCNSYPPRYIHNRFVKFFKSPLYTSTSILPLIDSHSHFAFVRSYLLDRTTTAQHQIASAIAKAIDSHDYDTEDDLLVRAQFRRKLKSMHNLVIPYIHEARFASYRILKRRLHSNNLPSTYNLLDHSIDNIEKMLASAQSTTLDKNIRTILSARRRKKIGQFKYDMLTLTVATGEEIVRSINKQIQEEKKLFFTMGDKNLNNPLLVPEVSSLQLMKAIETRQAHMVQRADFMTKQKLHSFFGEAPATCIELENNNSNNTVVGAHL